MQNFIYNALTKKCVSIKLLSGLVVWCPKPNILNNRYREDTDESIWRFAITPTSHGHVILHLHSIYSSQSAFIYTISLNSHNTIMLLLLLLLFLLMLFIVTGDRYTIKRSWWSTSSLTWMGHISNRILKLTKCWS